MAAAYQSGTATSQTDLVQKLVTWLVAQGWTQNMSQADGGGWRAHLSKSGFYINLRSFSPTDTSTAVWANVVTINSTSNGIALYAGTGYSGASNWRSQAGGPVQNGNSNTVGANVLIPGGTITRYHFFDDGLNNIVAVIEKTPGIFGACGWGNIIPVCPITGGAFFFGQYPGYLTTNIITPTAARGFDLNGGAPFNNGSCAPNTTYQDYPSAFVRVNVDAFTGKWVGNGVTTSIQGGYTGKKGQGDIPGLLSNDLQPTTYAILLPNTANVANGRGVMLPPNVYAERDAGGYSLIGRPPNIFVTRQVYDYASIVTVGSQNFMAFPCVTGSSDTPQTFLVAKMA